ncbi:glycosyltransferase family 2 protein [Kaistia terrae]|uniref:Glycosyltransferase family 2 protein n=1 Tax=Kaistia terrae TaxID=537017 RepID=A0ABW0PRR6_9HYPH|nr:glycosyltransferase family 2 protein [Kaistia terrae]MCX5577644.1 glycosyltransferase family 2 protein [Kaistia terrae]
MGKVTTTGATEIDLSIVICTFRREDLLAKALVSIRMQTLPEGTSLTVIVADNSDEGSAAAVVEAANAAGPFEIRYVAAHPANISVARNVGIAAATSPIIAFIDDDEELAPGWLAAVVAGLREHPHDVFFGGVDPVFETPDRVTPAIQTLFSRQIEAPSGQDVVALGKRGERAITVATCNSIFRRATTLADDQPFDPRFGHAGGEDLDLFCRLQARGRRFGWLPEARVFEFVPAGRCDPAYLRRRFFAGGQVYAEAVAGNSDAPLATRCWLRAKAMVQLGLLALRYPLVRRQGAAAKADFGYRWAGVLGKLSFGRLYPVYREAPPPKRA